MPFGNAGTPASETVFPPGAKEKTTSPEGAGVPLLGVARTEPTATLTAGFDVVNL